VIRNRNDSQLSDTLRSSAKRVLKEIANLDADEFLQEDLTWLKLVRTTVLLKRSDAKRAGIAKGPAIDPACSVFVARNRCSRKPAERSRLRAQLLHQLQ
jgi:hypothetical protein